MTAVEDKLEPAQRIRLESLAQAVQVTLTAGVGNILGSIARGESGPPPSSAELVIETAKRFESYVRDGSA